ncbi:MAG: histone-like protein [Promethearchaeota archaeon]
MAKKRRIFAWSPLRALMKKAGAEIVSRDSVELLLNYLEARSRKLTEVALIFAKHSKRKKISKGDMALAIENYH